ncbi:MAG: hypothetical protein OEU74_06105 [Gammaproteobacteria bacterium]|nr:hypothetical protein [Gammaproteobacteria bacterium]
MSIAHKLKHEIAAVIALTFYFGCWLGALVLFKYLLLAEYQIAFHDISVALVGALVLAKVVLVLEHVSLGAWVRAQPAWVYVMLRTLLYAFGVFILLLLEKALEGRHEHDGFGASLIAVFQQADAIHVVLNTICLSAALLSYNMLFVVRKRLGKGTLLRMFLTPLPAEPEQNE